MRSQSLFVLALSLSLSLGAGAAHAALPSSGPELAHLAPKAAVVAEVALLETRTLASPPPPGRQVETLRRLKALGATSPDVMVELVLRRAGAQESDARRERGRVTLVAGALEALAVVPDARGAAVARLVLASPEHASLVLDSAAEVLGRRASESDVELLVTLADRGRALHEVTLSSQRARAAVHGLGHARVARSIRYLGERLRTVDSDAAMLADAAGFAGSSWAWQALGSARADEGRLLRAELIDALVATWPLADDEGRLAIGRALILVDATRAAAQLGAIESGLPSTLRGEVALLKQRLATTRAR